MTGSGQGRHITGMPVRAWFWLRDMAAALYRRIPAPRPHERAPRWFAPRIFALRYLDVLIASGAIILFLFLFVDVPLMQWARGMDDHLKQPFRILVRFGKSDWILSLAFACGLCAYLAQRRAGLRARFQAGLRHIIGLSIFIFASIAASGLAVVVIKRIVGRARPRHFDQLGAYDFAPLSFASGMESLPSGHTVTAMALAMAMGFVLPVLRAPLLVFAAGMAFARIFLGSHYASDVAFALLFAVWSVLVLRLWFARRRIVFDLRSDGTLCVRGPRALKATAGYLCQRLRSGFISAIAGRSSSRRASP